MLKFEEKQYLFFIFALNVHVREFFSRHIFPAHFVGFLFSYVCRFLLFSLNSFAKMKAYTVCATAQASILRYSGHLVKEISNELLKTSER